MASNGRRLARKLAAYSTAALATAILSEDARGDVLDYSPPGGILTLDIPSDSVALDIDGDGQTDFSLNAPSWGFQLTPKFWPGANNAVYWDPATDSIYFAWIVAPGETIGPLSSGWWHSNTSMGYFNDMRGFVGLQFDIPGSSPHYGYLDVEINSAENRLTLYGGAYESVANTAITTPVPEPSSLGLLALGAVGLGAWRRRKQHGDRT